MGGDPLAARKAFDRGDGQANLDLAFDESGGNGIIMPVNLDVIIDPDARLAPFGIFMKNKNRGQTCNIAILSRVVPNFRAWQDG